MEQTKYLSYDNLTLYDSLLKGRMDAADAKALKTFIVEDRTFKFYTQEQPVGDATPAFSYTLPDDVDVSGLIPKISGATAGNIVTAKADGTVGDSGIKASDLATKAEVKANTDAIQAHKDAVDAKVTTLVGSDTNKSVRTIANEELAAQLIPENAKESLDTLAELASWIQNHPDDASAMNTAIESLKTLVGTIPEDATATTIVAYIKELVDAEKARAMGVEGGLNTRVGDIESKLGTGAGSVTEQIATAKQEAINTAAGDATTKANQALTDAKKYTDDEIKKIDLSGIDTNASAIAGLTTRTSTAESKITAVETKASANESSIGTLQSTSDSHGEKIQALENKVGAGFTAISENDIRALFA